MLRSASSASGEVGSLVMATVNAPARRASASISIVSSVRPVVEMPIATVFESWMAALVRPLWTSDQAYAGTPMR